MAREAALWVCVYHCKSDSDEIARSIGNLINYDLFRVTKSCFVFCKAFFQPDDASAENNGERSMHADFPKLGWYAEIGRV